MEVHAHASRTSGARKKWTHYFWEFLMLFLAVFCGFLAENIREHKIEKQREKQYVESLLKDIEYDTLQFDKTIVLLERKLPYYDSVLLFFQNPSAYNNALPFRFYIQTNFEQFYTPAGPTMEQLKGSGNLRLIHKQLTLDSILNYDSRLTGAYKNQTEYVIEANKRLIHSVETVFDLSNFNVFVNDIMADSSAGGPSVYDTRLISTNKETLQAVTNIYISAKATDFFYIQTIRSTKKLAVQLILFLKKEYRLK